MFSTRYLTVIVVCLLSAAPVFRHISDRPHDVNVTEGDSVTINCFAYAKPQARVQWFQNGQPLNCKPRLQVINE